MAYDWLSLDDQIQHCKIHRVYGGSQFLKSEELEFRQSPQLCCQGILYMSQICVVIESSCSNTPVLVCRLDHPFKVFCYQCCKNVWLSITVNTKEMWPAAFWPEQQWCHSYTSVTYTKKHISLIFPCYNQSIYTSTTIIWMFADKLIEKAYVLIAERYR